jgi:hypothetical protein
VSLSREEIKKVELSPGLVVEGGVKTPSVRLPEATGATKSLKLARDTVEEYQGPFGATERVPPLKTFHIKDLAVGVIFAVPDPGT